MRFVVYVFSYADDMLTDKMMGVTDSKTYEAVVFICSAVFVAELIQV